VSTSDPLDQPTATVGAGTALAHSIAQTSLSLGGRRFVVRLRSGEVVAAEVSRSRRPSRTRSGSTGRSTRARTTLPPAAEKYLR
jgi:hypothetical protein